MKNNQDNQSNSKCNFMQDVFLEKCICGIRLGMGVKPPEAGEFLRIFVLQTLKVTFNCKLLKKGGAGCTTCSPNNFVGAATASSPPPVPTPLLPVLQVQLNCSVKPIKCTVFQGSFITALDIDCCLKLSLAYIGRGPAGEFEGTAAPGVGQSHHSSGRSQQPKMEKNMFLYLLNEKTKFIPSSKMKCPKSGIFTNNNWVG